MGSRRKIFQVIGPGMIAAVAGLEITNIGIFTFIGSKYNINLLWIIVLATMITAFIQQIAAEVGLHVEKDVFTCTKEVLGGRFYTLLVVSLFVSNVVTASLNILGASIALELLLGVKWFYSALLISSLTISLSMRENYSSIEKILTILALSLGVFIIIAIKAVVDHPDIIFRVLVSVLVPETGFRRETLLPIIMIFGAAAAPYSILFQVESTRNNVGKRTLLVEFADIAAGLFFTVFLSISICIVASEYLYSSTETISIRRMLITYSTINPMILYLFTLGIVASSLLSTISILMCNSLVLDNWIGRNTGLDETVKSNRYLRNLLFTIVPCIMGILYAGAMTDFSQLSFSFMIIPVSIITSFCSWVPSFTVSYLYWMKIKDKSLIVSILSFLASSIILIVNIFGIIVG